MLRLVSTALRGLAGRTASTTTNLVVSKCNSVTDYTQYRGFGALSTIARNWTLIGPSTQCKTLLNQTEMENRLAVPIQPVVVPVRTQTKASRIKGKRATVRTVLKRFYRLHWGMWIRTKAGRKSHLWRKSSKRKKRLREHVFCNATQCTLLDKMVSRYWRRRHYYVDDPYEPYHQREEFWITRRKPLP